jgi:hypothetical protein
VERWWFNVLRPVCVVRLGEEGKTGSTRKVGSSNKDRLMALSNKLKASKISVAEG